MSITETNAVSPSGAPSVEASSSPKIAGYMRLLLAMLDNADAVQNYVSNGLMPLSEAVATQSLESSNEFIKEEDKLIADMKGKKGDDLTKLTTQFNELNTKGSASQSYFNGLTGGLTDTTSNTNTQVSNVYQMLQTSVLAIQQTIVSAL